MHRIRLIAALSVLTASFLVLALCAGHPATTAKTEAPQTSGSFPEKARFDLDGYSRYRQQQLALAGAVKAYFEKALASGEIVGAGVSIVQGDSILLSDGYGAKSRKTGDRVDGETLFRLGSLSKGFTGILAAGLVQEGKMSWNDRVVDFLPEFRLGNTANTRQITLAHLLSHTTGAPYHSFTNLIEAGRSLPDIAGHFREVNPVSTPGAVYSYQNAMFALSSEMMLQVTGEPIECLLEERFLKPLGMCSTTMDYTALKQQQNVALPHVRGRGGWRTGKLSDSYFNAIAAGGINASPVDMARWMRFLLGHNPEVMGKQSLEWAFRPVVEIKGRAKYYHRWPGHIASYYGYGWRIHQYAEEKGGNRKTIWHHGGSVNNFRNEIALFPESDLGICVLLNSNSTLAKRVIPELYEIVQSVYKQTPEHLALNSLSGASEAR